MSLYYLLGKIQRCRVHDVSLQELSVLERSTSLFIAKPNVSAHNKRKHPKEHGQIPVVGGKINEEFVGEGVLESALLLVKITMSWGGNSSNSAIVLEREQ